MVTREDVLQMARLSKLYIKEEELDALTKDMDNIIAFAETISTAQCEQTNFDNINNFKECGKSRRRIFPCKKTFLINIWSHFIRKAWLLHGNKL